MNIFKGCCSFSTNLAPVASSVTLIDSNNTTNMQTEHSTGPTRFVTFRAQNLENIEPWAMPAATGAGKGSFRSCSGSTLLDFCAVPTNRLGLLRRNEAATDMGCAKHSQRSESLLQNGKRERGQGIVKQETFSEKNW